MKIKKTYDFGNTESPEYLVILLHGLGSNGQDLISLALYFAKNLPEAVFVSPDAPFLCDMAPGMPHAFQWFSLQDRDPAKILDGIKVAAPVLEGFIADQLEKYDIPADKCALVGFSQGTMMSLHVGPRYKEKLAGVLGYSGALFWEESTNPDDLHKIAIHLIHGTMDDVVPVEAHHNAKNTLKTHNFKVTGYTQPGLTHSIDEPGIASGAEFLKKALN